MVHLFVNTVKFKEHCLGGCPRMPFCPNSSLFQKNNARNISHMTALVFWEMPRFWTKYLFSDKLLGGCPRMPFCPNSSLFQKTMLVISVIWLCLFLRNASILDKMPILGQAPRRLSENAHEKSMRYLYKLFVIVKV